MCKFYTSRWMYLVEMYEFWINFQHNKLFAIARFMNNFFFFLQGKCHLYMRHRIYRILRSIDLSIIGWGNSHIRPWQVCRILLLELAGNWFVQKCRDFDVFICCCNLRSCHRHWTVNVFIVIECWKTSTKCYIKRLHNLFFRWTFQWICEPG